MVYTSPKKTFFSVAGRASVVPERTDEMRKSTYRSKGKWKIYSFNDFNIILRWGGYFGVERQGQGNARETEKLTVAWCLVCQTLELVRITLLF